MCNKLPSLVLPLSIRPYCDGFAIIDDNDMVIAASHFPLDDGHASDPEHTACAIVQACNLLPKVLPYLELAAARLADEDKPTEAARGWNLAQRVRTLAAADQNKADEAAS